MPVRHYKVAPIQALCKNSDSGGSAKQYTESKGLFERCHRDYILRVSRRFVYKRFSRLGPCRFRFVGFRAYASNVRDPNLVGLSVSGSGLVRVLVRFAIQDARGFWGSGASSARRIRVGLAVWEC